MDEGENGETKVKTAETFEEYCDKLRGIDKQTFAKINELSSKLLEGRKKKKFKAQRYSDISVWDDNYYNPNDGDAFMASCMNFSGKTYYACEAPQPQYFKQFWKMVWNTQTKTIFMLTNLMEKRKIKACAYWGDVRKVETYDDIVVSYVSDTFFKVNQNDVVDKVPKLEGPTKESYIQKRTFQLTSNRETHTVVQYHYLNWPDMGTPDKCALVDYLRQQHDITSPSVVHCSAGVGRTGTFIAYDSLVRECKQNKKAAVSKIDVNERILQMRFYRDGMVQTDGQRQFIEDACKYTLNK
ncbi:MAG: tyrosine-protein phosphatase [Chlamydiales bacterium]|nr:tyrosine-protein phosphatase [Chlamydiales bacterium]